MKLSIHIDGGSRGNPGPAAVGLVLHEQGKSIPVLEAGYFLGKTTNNVAEYTGLIKALEHAIALKASDVQIYSDSELMVRQITGEYRVKSPDLKPLFEQAQHLLLKIDQWQIKHVRRELNKRADELVNMSLDKRKDIVLTEEPALAGDGSTAAPAPHPSTAPTASPATSSPAEHGLADPSCPSWSARLIMSPGESCPARMPADKTYRFGPRTPSGFCVHAAARVLADGPLQWPRGKREGAVDCGQCGCPIHLELESE